MTLDYERLITGSYFNANNYHDQTIKRGSHSIYHDLVLSIS